MLVLYSGGWRAFIQVSHEYSRYYLSTWLASIATWLLLLHSTWYLILNPMCQHVFADSSIWLDPYKTRNFRVLALFQAHSTRFVYNIHRCDFDDVMLINILCCTSRILYRYVCLQWSRHFLNFPWPAFIDLGYSKSLPTCPMFIDSI